MYNNHYNYIKSLKIPKE